MSETSIPSIGEQARRGGQWVVAVQILTKLMGYGVMIVLARLLLPSDYGLFGMAAVFSGLVLVIGDVGMSAALTQSQDDAPRLAITAFWMNLGVALGLSVLQFLVAPFVARFYGMSIVGDILRISALTYVLSALGTIHNTLLSRELKFKKQTLLRLIVMTTSWVLSIVLAWFGAGPWSLVLPPLFVAPLQLILLWRIVPWRPRFQFSMIDARKIFRFGRNVLFTDVIRHIGNNLDFLLIGRFYGAQSLGIYTFAYNQAMLGLSTITGSAGRVIFPTYSAILREGRSFEHAHRRSTRLVALVAFPAQLGLLVIAHSYIPMIFGDRWSEAVPLFQVMVIFGLIRSVASLGGAALSAAGKPELELRWNLIMMPLMSISVLIGSLFSPFGVALATGMTGSIGSVIFMAYVCRFLAWKYWALMDVLRPAVVSSIIMLALVGVNMAILEYWLIHPIITLGTTMILGIVTYYFVLKLFFHEALDEISWLINGKYRLALKSSEK